MEQLSQNLQKAISNLNPAQKEATLNIAGPELIIAGAGSGKTRVLTTRMALLLEKGVMPERILALTFTKKAAEEMRKRIIEMSGPKAARLQMGTFHSVFIRFLRPWAHMLGFPASFTILDEDDAMSCLKRCIKAVLEKGRVPKDARTKQLEQQYKAEDACYKPKSVMNRISNCKNQLITADNYAADPEMKRSDRLRHREKLPEIFREYRDACWRSGTMDYDDILLYTDMLMANHPEALEIIASGFDYILVDEYQDTNFAQYSILRRLTLRNKNICVVGDDSQSIYAFRGARIENIFNFTKEYKGCKTVRLEQNYRSTTVIVEAANRLIEHNSERIPKTCFSEAQRGAPIEWWETDDERQEAAFIADTLLEQSREQKIKYRDMAVLYRTNSQSRALEDAFVRKKIPYVIYSGTSFFERLEVKDQMAYFRLAVNPDDDEAFRRVVNKPARGVGEAALSRLSDMAHTAGISLWKALCSESVADIGLTAKALEGLEAFRRIIEDCNAAAGGQTAFRAAYNIANIAGLYQEYISDETEDSRNRADNIRELVDSVKAYEEELNQRQAGLKDEDREPSTLTGYLQNAMLLSNADTADGTDDKVNIMTAHCAKGLEFESVIIAGMEEGLFPLMGENDHDEEEEERRLFYVAVTRAKKNLIITNAERRMRFGKRQSCTPSRFIRELLGN